MLQRIESKWQWKTNQSCYNFVPLWPSSLYIPPLLILKSLEQSMILYIRLRRLHKEHLYTIVKRTKACCFMLIVRKLCVTFLVSFNRHVDHGVLLQVYKCFFLSLSRCTINNVNAAMLYKYQCEKEAVDGSSMLVTIANKVSRVIL